MVKIPRTPSATPTPMPTFAPVLRPEECGESVCIGALVAEAVVADDVVTSVVDELVLVLLELRELVAVG